MIRSCIVIHLYYERMTYNETATNFRPQLEKPMSTPLANPIPAIFLNVVRQSSNILCFPVL